MSGALHHSLGVLSVIIVRNKQTALLLFAQEITYYEYDWVIKGIVMGTDDTAGRGIKGGRCQLCNMIRDL